MSQRVTLVFTKSYVENPNFADSFAEKIQVELPAHINRAHLIAARTHGDDDSVKASNQFPHDSDFNAIIWDYRDTDHLLGQLLTYIDATYSDLEQRKAHKDIVKRIVRDNIQEVYTRGVQTVNAHTKYK